MTEHRALPSPVQLRAVLPIAYRQASVVAQERDAIRRIVAGVDRRLLAVVGLCSIHEVVARSARGRLVSGRKDGRARYVNRFLSQAPVRQDAVTRIDH